MPNHITNKLLIVEDKTSKKVIKYMKEKHPVRRSISFTGREIVSPPYISYMDFNKIIPMPDYIYQGDLGIEEERLYGRENCWYHWGVNNWGTKWNAYDSFIDSNNRITFNTAWSGVPTLMGILSQKFPDSKFIYKFSDENAGYGVGYYEFMNGRIIENRDIEPCSVSAYRIYYDCNDVNTDYIILSVNRNEEVTVLYKAAVRDGNM